MKNIDPKTIHRHDILVSPRDMPLSLVRILWKILSAVRILSAIVSSALYLWSSSFICYNGFRLLYAGVGNVGRKKSQECFLVACLVGGGWGFILVEYPLDLSICDNLHFKID